MPTQMQRPHAHRYGSGICLTTSCSAQIYASATPILVIHDFIAEYLLSLDQPDTDCSACATGRLAGSSAASALEPSVLSEPQAPPFRSPPNIAKSKTDNKVSVSTVTTRKELCQSARGATPASGREQQQRYPQGAHKACQRMHNCNEIVTIETIDNHTARTYHTRTRKEHHNGLLHHAVQQHR